MTLKSQINTRKMSFGSWITFANEASAEIMASAGFDWLTLDMEHAPLGLEACAKLIRVIDLKGVPVFCRLPGLEPNLIKNVLDAGAKGIIIPMIESAEQAKRAVDSAFYPPVGKRGVGLARAQGYGASFEDYRQKSNDTIIIAMIETATGVANVEAIAATKGIDGLLIGPYDLSGSLGVIGKLDDPQVIAAQKKVLDVAKKAGIGCGLHVVHPNSEAIQRAQAQDFTFLALGVDMIYLDQAAKSTVAFAQKSK